METTPYVEYERFVALTGHDLCQYLEPLLSKPATMVSYDVLQRLQSGLSSYDEYHLVYALILGSRYAPDTFALLLPRYLAHEAGSVWSTALNSLDGLPDKYVTRELVESVRAVYYAHPTKAWVAELLERLEARLRSR